MSRCIQTLALLVAVATATPAIAQKKQCLPGKASAGKFHAGYGLSHRYGHYGRHQGFALGSAHAFYNHYPNRIHAFADLTRARGYANLRNAQALTEFEVARRARLDNDVHALVTHYERREINRDARFGDVYRRAAERKVDAAVAAAMEVPSNEATLTSTQTVLMESGGLQADEIDQRTGRIDWPTILSTTRYSKARQPIDQLFKLRAQEGLIATRHLAQTDAWLQKVINEVDERDDLSHREIAETIEFLNRLINESRLPRQAIVSLEDLDHRIASN